MNGTPRDREVTLLPRHWAWLARQPRSASASLRQLVEDALRDRDGRYRLREARETCYAYLRAHAGDRPHFEAANRALFGGRSAEFGQAVADWPPEVRCQALELAAASWEAA